MLLFVVSCVLVGICLYGVCMMQFGGWVAWWCFADYACGLSLLLAVGIGWWLFVSCCIVNSVVYCAVHLCVLMVCIVCLLLVICLLCLD